MTDPLTSEERFELLLKGWDFLETSHKYEKLAIFAYIVSFVVAFTPGFIYWLATLAVAIIAQIASFHYLRKSEYILVEVEK